MSLFAKAVRTLEPNAILEDKVLNCFEFLMVTRRIYRKTQGSGATGCVLGLFWVYFGSIWGSNGFESERIIREWWQLGFLASQNTILFAKWWKKWAYRSRVDQVLSQNIVKHMLLVEIFELRRSFWTPAVESRQKPRKNRVSRKFRRPKYRKTQWFMHFYTG